MYTNINVQPTGPQPEPIGQKFNLVVSAHDAVRGTNSRPKRLPLGHLLNTSVPAHNAVRGTNSRPV